MELAKIYRFPYTGEYQWLKVTKKTDVKIIEGKKFFSHGNLVDTESAGNGYHGRCEHCGLPLVTDLGYNSWKDTKCEIKPKKKKTTNIKFSWHKDSKKASIINKDEATKYFRMVIREQGWGTYNFQIKTV